MIKKIKNLVTLTAILLLCISTINCSKAPVADTSSSNSGTTGNGMSAGFPVNGTEVNVMSLTVGCGYVNMPCATVKICVPGTTQCETVSNLLVDTGSSGLRVFSSAISASLKQNLPRLVSNAKSLSDCVVYADYTTQWGAVVSADVGLGKEKALNVPIQVVDFTSDPIPASTECGQALQNANSNNNVGTNSNPYTEDVASTGYNGIIGVGLFVQDCGPGCDPSSASTNYDPNQNGIYFGCTNASCTSTAVSVSQQISNPVYFLPADASNFNKADNNGVILQFPQISDSGAASLNGYMILGIGTRTDNMPGQNGDTPVTFPTDGNGTFQTSYEGHTMTAFIDSGSNSLTFPSSTLPTCTINNLGTFFCPSSLSSQQATQISGSISQNITFNIENPNTFLSGSNIIFNDIGLPVPSSITGEFDWGFPFFLGRTVFVGMENQISVLGVGPYWSY